MKRYCVECKKRPALFFYRGKPKADKDHDLCNKCYKSLIMKVQSSKLPEANGKLQSK